ncbi:MAG: hypothetical protein WBB01_24240 [Phormidesmis sp.]
MPQLILYACPVGPLAQQIAAYFETSQRLCGPNAAHAYTPHCTLTGFFRDEERAIALYLDTLESILSVYRKRIPKLPISITQLTFRADWHGLEIEANGLKRLAVDFAAQANSPTRRGPLRLKEWLHLSLAYDFDPTCESALRQFATGLIDLSTPVSWELRLYERSPDNHWQCHHCWSI